MRTYIPGEDGPEHGGETGATPWGQDYKELPKTIRTEHRTCFNSLIRSSAGRAHPTKPTHSPRKHPNE